MSTAVVVSENPPTASLFAVPTKSTALSVATDAEMAW